MKIKKTSGNQKKSSSKPSSRAKQSASKGTSPRKLAYKKPTFKMFEEVRGFAALSTELKGC